MKALLIVESPTKAKTIKKFLGAQYDVVSSFGHIRDLPKSDLGVDIKKHFEPTYIVPDDKKQRVADLKKAAKRVDEVYLATDEDREGEAISWHLAQLLDLDVERVKRIAFHEITKHAIEEALKNPRHIMMDLVDAQQARRVLDRLVGYELSPFLWKKVQRGLSAGRVQSVAVRLIVERERERQAFKQDEYWSITGNFESKGEHFESKLFSIDGKSLEKAPVTNEADAMRITSELKDATFTVANIEKKEVKKKAPTPLRTSVLQQEANNKLGFSAKQTMRLAQQLYETGRITYMRTDSINLSDKFLGEAQSFIQSTFGDKYAKGAVRYKTSDKSAQEAHEAIRPTDPRVTPDDLRGELEPQAYKLYDLIWRRTLASQMPSAVLERTGIALDTGAYRMKANGSTIVFDGFMRVYRAANETVLPQLTQGDALKAKTIDPKQHFTQPPARYSDASLIKALEEHGVGRPSTYAPTISTIESRGYVERDDQKKLAPTDIAFIVTDLLVGHFSHIVDLEFTAEMEKQFDEIAEGNVKWQKVIGGFYTPFHENLKEKEKTLTREDVVKPILLGEDPKTKLPIHVRTGRFGAYVQLGNPEDKETIKNVSIPKNIHFDQVTLEQALELLSLPRHIGNLEDGTEILGLIGPYGPYLKADKVNASLPPELDVLTVTESQAREVVRAAAEIRKQAMTPLAELGEDPESKGKILIKTGRFGPYITDGKTNVSIPKSTDPLSVDLASAIERLAAKRANPRARWMKKKADDAKAKKPKAKKSAAKKPRKTKKNEEESVPF